MPVSKNADCPQKEQSSLHAFFLMLCSCSTSTLPPLALSVIWLAESASIQTSLSGTINKAATSWNGMGLPASATPRHLSTNAWVLSITLS